MNSHNHFINKYKINKAKCSTINNLIHASVPEAILETNKLTNAEKVLYEQILTQIVEEGICFKSNRRLATEVKLSKRMIPKFLRHFVRLHLMTVKYEHQHKQGQRIMILSDSNIHKLKSLDKRFCYKHEIVKKDKSIKQQPGVKPNKHSRYINQRSKLSDTDTHNIDIIAHKINKFKPSFSTRTAKKIIISKWQNGKANLQNLELALIITEYIDRCTTTKVYNFVCMLCSKSTIPTKELKRAVKQEEPILKKHINDSKPLTQKQKNYLANDSNNDFHF